MNEKAIIFTSIKNLSICCCTRRQSRRPVCKPLKRYPDTRCCPGRHYPSFAVEYLTPNSTWKGHRTNSAPITAGVNCLTNLKKLLLWIGGAFKKFKERTNHTIPSPGACDSVCRALVHNWPVVAAWRARLPMATNRPEAMEPRVLSRYHYRNIRTIAARTFFERFPLIEFFSSGTVFFRKPCVPVFSLCVCLCPKATSKRFPFSYPHYNDKSKKRLDLGGRPSAGGLPKAM